MAIAPESFEGCKKGHSIVTRTFLFPSGCLVWMIRENLSGCQLCSDRNGVSRAETTACMIRGSSAGDFTCTNMKVSRR